MYFYMHDSAGSSFVTIWRTKRAVMRVKRAPLHRYLTSLVARPSFQIGRIVFNCISQLLYTHDLKTSFGQGVPTNLVLLQMTIATNHTLTWRSVALDMQFFVSCLHIICTQCAIMSNGFTPVLGSVLGTYTVRHTKGHQ